LANPLEWSKPQMDLAGRFTNIAERSEISFSSRRRSCYETFFSALKIPAAPLERDLHFVPTSCGEWARFPGSNKLRKK